MGGGAGADPYRASEMCWKAVAGRKPGQTRGPRGPKPQPPGAENCCNEGANQKGIWLRKEGQKKLSPIRECGSCKRSTQFPLHEGRRAEKNKLNRKRGRKKKKKDKGKMTGKRTAPQEGKKTLKRRRIRSKNQGGLKEKWEEKSATSKTCWAGEAIQASGSCHEGAKEKGENGTKKKQTQPENKKNRGASP